MYKLTIKPVENNEEYAQVLKIRKDVFIKEQNVPENVEIDEYDSKATYFIVTLNNTPIGYARIRFNDKAKLERIAKINKHRGKGYGIKLTNFLIEYCLGKKIKKIYLHSQCYILDFYKKLGFKQVGEKIFEADIEHVAMEMTIP